VQIAPKGFLSTARVLAGGSHVIRESEHLFVAAASHQQIVEPVLARANGCVHHA
jgi:hypothetical protein